MSEFFRGWKQKVGCITLVMAVVFFLGYIRGCLVSDEYEYRLNQTDSFYVYNSARGIGFSCIRLGGGSWQFTAPYLFLIFPLAILSAWLLLGKKRSEKPPILPSK